jgi:hypothetical protein
MVMNLVFISMMMIFMGLGLGENFRFYKLSYTTQL